MVAFHISLKLRHPISGVVARAELGKAGIKLATVPEVSIAEHRNPLAMKDYVRQPWDISPV